MVRSRCKEAGLVGASARLALGEAGKSANEPAGSLVERAAGSAAENPRCLVKQPKRGSPQMLKRRNGEEQAEPVAHGAILATIRPLSTA